MLKSESLKGSSNSKACLDANVNWRSKFSKLWIYRLLLLHPAHLSTSVSWFRFPFCVHSTSYQELLICLCHYLYRARRSRALSSYEYIDFGYSGKFFNIKPYHGYNFVGCRFSSTKRNVVTMTARGKKFAALHGKHHRLCEGVGLASTRQNM
jgi:hypothetical protein